MSEAQYSVGTSSISDKGGELTLPNYVPLDTFNCFVPVDSY